MWDQRSTRFIGSAISSFSAALSRVGTGRLTRATPATLHDQILSTTATAKYSIAAVSLYQNSVSAESAWATQLDLGHLLPLIDTMSMWLKRRKPDVGAGKDLANHERCAQHPNP